MQDLLIQLHSVLMVPERLPTAFCAIILALCLSVLFGARLWGPLCPAYAVFDALFGSFGKRLDRYHRSAAALRLRGLVFTLALLLVILIALKLLVGAIGSLNGAYRFVAEAFLLSLFLCGAGPLMMAQGVQKALKTGGPPAMTYRPLALGLRVDLNSADQYGLARQMLGYLAFCFDKALVAPVLWYVILGAPGAIIHGLLAFMAWRFGKAGFHSGFAAVPLALERLMGVAPGLFAGVLLAAAGALTPTGHIFKALSLWWTMRNKAPYEQGGFALSALAWPLGVVLGGPVIGLDGENQPRKWVGPSQASAQVEPGHILRGMVAIALGVVLLVLVLSFAVLFAHFQF